MMFCWKLKIASRKHHRILIDIEIKSQPLPSENSKKFVFVEQSFELFFEVSQSMFTSVCILLHNLLRFLSDLYNVYYFLNIFANIWCVLQYFTIFWSFRNWVANLLRFSKHLCKYFVTFATFYYFWTCLCCLRFFDLSATVLFL